MPGFASGWCFRLHGNWRESSEPGRNRTYWRWYRIRGHDGRARSHVHALADATNLERDVNAERLTRHQLQIARQERLESRRFALHRISASLEVQQLKVTEVVGPDG